MFDVSIIIPVYKAKYTIKKTLESINNQKFKNKIPKIELILSIEDNRNYELISGYYKVQSDMNIIDGIISMIKYTDLQMVK